MDMKEIIRRRITLKEQHIYLIQREMEALRSDLKRLGNDPAFIPKTGNIERQSGETVRGRKNG